ncbi:hypothetical protein DFH09DRAFT_1150314, partial [Mycena vulgaris]
MLRICITLLPILSVAAQTSMNVRQDFGDCVAPCLALTDSISAQRSGDLGAICTNTVVTNYASCYDCEVRLGGMTQTEAQAVDAYIAGCKAGGHPINSVTISGAASGGGSSPAASGGSAPPPAASGTSLLYPAVTTSPAA